ncbi:LacI family DNA-binding transcriptional regulator [Alkalibacterium gilvum]|uniref:LacI family DNA-binding transcriptional regulator n=1 Tax=Alkalibacterium gilvum TaxID=1130080 RepID=UPI000ECD728F|nr:LacI family transcriptional regulator [Alkalibacterium sp.]
MSVRLKDIAKIAGVSVGTVSRVINQKTSEIGEETVKRVEKVIKEEGYVPNIRARSLKTNRSNILGLLIPSIKNPFFTEIVRGVEDTAYDLGYSVILCNTYDNFDKETKYLNTLHELRVDGIIVAGSYDRNKEKEEAYSFNVPLIAIDRAVYYKNISTFITTDNYSSSEKIAEILFENGYRSFFYLGGPKTNSVAKKRYKGTKAGLKKKEISKFKEVFGNFSIEDGYTLIHKEKNIKDYDVIISGNDLLAMGAIQALREKNIDIPNEISVFGFDDMEIFSEITPKLSTVKQPSYLMGVNSVKMIDKTLNGQRVKEKYELPQKLLFRDTTKVKLNE